MSVLCDHQNNTGTADKLKGNFEICCERKFGLVSQYQIDKDRSVVFAHVLH
jgi:hypothetical protein